MFRERVAAISIGTVVRTSSMETTATPLIAPGFRSASSILLVPWRLIPASTRLSSLTLGRQSTSYNLRHFTPITTISIPGLNGFPGNQLIRWGQNGLAFTTSGGQIVLVAGNFLDPIAVPPPAPVVVPTPAPTPTPTAQTPTISSLSPSGTIAGGPSFTITVNGTNFLNNSVVQFNSARACHYIRLQPHSCRQQYLQDKLPLPELLTWLSQIPRPPAGIQFQALSLLERIQINGNTLAVFNQPSKRHSLRSIASGHLFDGSRQQLRTATA